MLNYYSITFNNSRITGWGDMWQINTLVKLLSSWDFKNESDWDVWSPLKIDKCLDFNCNTFLCSDNRAHRVNVCLSPVTPRLSPSNWFPSSVSGQRHEFRSGEGGDQGVWSSSRRWNKPKGVSPKLQGSILSCFKPAQFSITEAEDLFVWLYLCHVQQMIEYKCMLRWCGLCVRMKQECA